VDTCSLELFEKKSEQKKIEKYMFEFLSNEFVE
jgi:hypothetical protein